MDNKEKLNTAVKLAQSYILLFLKEQINHEHLLKVQNLFETCPVVIQQLDVETNEFGKRIKAGGVAKDDGISISLDDINTTNINIEIELNNLLGVIIHEYAHKIRALNNKNDAMFEEAFATIFAEICINNARLKLNFNQDNKEIFQLLTSVNYQKYESHVRGLLYILKQNGLDQKSIAEFIAGNEEEVKQTCSQILGNDLNNYFEAITSINNANVEQIEIDIITQYIKQNGLNISDYWKQDRNQLAPNNLYFYGSSTLSKAIVNAGIESFKKEDQEFYKFFEYSVKTANETEAFTEEEKIDRIKQFIETKFSLHNKSLKEIYDTIIDLCSTYIQHKNRDNEESKIFIAEITRLIPDIDDFKTKFVNLRIRGLDKNIFDNLDLNNITYFDII